jgi:IclR family pca regulon transcriptional regulator
MPRFNRSTNIEGDAEVGPDFLEGVARGIRVIEAFNKTSRPLTLSDTAKIVGLPRATTRRVLHTLEKLGFVVSDGKLFSLTSRILTLASAYLSSNQISTVLQPVMDRIAAEVQEVCSAAIMNGDDVVFIARATPARVFSTGLELGYRLPAYCTSVGRVLLGALNDDELASVMQRIDPVAPTPHTVVDKSVLTALIVTARNQGYALVDQEAEAGFRSISVPVCRYDGTVVAAMNIGAHVDRVTVGRMIDVYRRLLIAGADEVRPLLM